METKKKNLFLILLFVVVSMALLFPRDDKTPAFSKNQDKLLFGIYSVRTFDPDFASIGHRGYFNSVWKVFMENEPKKNTLADFKRKPLIIDDTLKIPAKVQTNKAHINISFLYGISDNFIRLASIFKIGGNIYFFQGGGIKRDNLQFDRVFRINDDRWYQLVTRTNFRIAADFGDNHVLGYCIEKPLRLYGFRNDFKGDFFTRLPDLRYRQELYKLNQQKFIFHNFRTRPYDHSVEIYGIDGKRIKECFNVVPYHFQWEKAGPGAYQTVLTTDKKGSFYIAFQYPLNPYRVWKFDENGTKSSVFGNYFVDPAEFSSPPQWIGFNPQEVSRSAAGDIYAINKILIDEKGRILVFFSKNRGSYGQRYFFDIYSSQGEFIGRQSFPYGFPELIDNGLIYSRQKESSGRFKWKITVARLEIK